MAVLPIGPEAVGKSPLPVPRRSSETRIASRPASITGWAARRHSTTTPKRIAAGSRSGEDRSTIRRALAGAEQQRRRIVQRIGAIEAGSGKPDRPKGAGHHPRPLGGQHRPTLAAPQALVAVLLDQPEQAAAFPPPR